MVPKNSKLLVLLLLIQLVLPQHIVHADTGPKPTMDFAFDQSLLPAPVTIVSGILYECQQSDCSDAHPLEEVGPQGFNCSTDSCDAMAYGFAPYHKLEIEFSDGKTRQSNIFETAGFESRYNVTINPEDLSVETLSSLPAPRWTLAVLLIFACILCGGVLLVAGIVFIIWRFLRK